MRLSRFLATFLLSSTVVMAQQPEVVSDFSISDVVSAGSVPSQFTSLGDWIYFTADDGIHGVELMKSDGTVEGTSLVKDFLQGDEGSEPILHKVGETLLIAVKQENGQQGVYRVDGDGSEPKLLTDRFHPRFGDGPPNGAFLARNYADGILYYWADGVLWSNTDGVDEYLGKPFAFTDETETSEILVVGDTQQLPAVYTAIAFCFKYSYLFGSMASSMW